MTYIGGPTLLIDWHGLRLLTDPTFDPAGGIYSLGPVVLTKTTTPSITADSLGKIDLVLLSHDEHSDNLDRSGRELLPHAEKVLTTRSGATRLGGNAQGLDPWESLTFPTPDGSSLKITATPARHGPEGCEPICGDVIGFVLESSNASETLYVTGDTVWYEGVAEVARKFQVSTVVLFVGAATLKEVGPAHLTMNAEDALAASSAFPRAKLIPLHYEGWAHFLEGREYLSRAFQAAGIQDRVRWLEAGRGETV
jgi:L-ascorbate metabolism protein UlaG (beta-lactamase superfamily)